VAGDGVIECCSSCMGFHLASSMLVVMLKGEKRAVARLLVEVRAAAS
jgi:hypothetical protein